MSVTRRDFKVWDGICRDFPNRDNPAEGFADDASLERLRVTVGEALAHVQRGEPTAKASIYNQYPLPIVLAMLDDDGPIRVLDFGGGLGQTYLAVRATTCAKEGLEFYILEQERIVRAGRNLFHDDINVRFVTGFGEVPPTVDVVHSASAFQYVDDWRGLLKRFATLTPKYIVFGNLLAGEIEPCVTFQNYWGHKIPVRFHNYQAVTLALAELGYHVVFDAFHEQTILGQRQPLPLSHFPEKHRLVYGRNMILKRDEH
ncbi:MAG: methyltransferase, TIGR04325 family [Pseudolabrys sp.]|jgi:putative methyltransferase (TIGR04325 family)